MLSHAFLALLVVAFGQTPANAAPGLPRMTSEALRDDAAVLRQALETLHPGLYRYNSAAEMATHFADLDRALDHDQTVAEAFVAFTRLVANIRCGHTYPNLANQPPAIVEVLTGGTDRLPFQFRWIDRTMVVTDDAVLPRGTIVDAIDGTSTSRILDELIGLVRADGHNDAKRIDLLKVERNDRFAAFDVYYPLLHPKTEPQFTLTVRASSNARPHEIRVAAITQAQRAAAVARDDAAADHNPLNWTLDLRDGHVAVLRMPTWTGYRSRWDWKGFVRQAFEALRSHGTRDLVIDLRGNEGGDDVGAEIATHLVAQPVAAANVVRWTRYRRVPDALRPFLDTWDKSFFDWGDAADGPDERGLYRLVRADDADGGLVRPAAPRFAGHVDVLVDAANSSATFGFAEWVQSRHLATLVGVPTGGNLRGINGGAFFFLRLPASHIEIDIPLIGQYPPREMPDRGLEPDVVVASSIADIADGVDAAMADVDRAASRRASTAARP